MYEEQFRRRTIWAAFLLAALACALFLLLNPRGYRALLVARLFRTNNPPIVVPLPKDFQPRLPPGFTASVLAGGFDEPRWLAVAPNGDLFVAESAAGKVIVLHFSVSKGRVQSREIFADHLLLPFGIAFHEDFVYVALTNRVVRFHYDRETSRRLGEAEAILDLPGLGYNQHWTRSLAFSPDGNELFVSVGSRTNVSIESDPRRAAILVLRSDGGGMRVYANGLRNAVGIAFSPASGDLWATVNERDDIAEDIPSDFFTHVVQGGFYGWPYAYLGPHIDDRVAARPDLVEKAIIPDLLLGAHVAPLQFAFYEATQFPSLYRHGAFVAEHGSWNRKIRSGYQVVFIPFQDGFPSGEPRPFLSGFVPDPVGKQVYGRMVGVAIARDGSLLVSDDAQNLIWRVSYNTEPSAVIP
ncbi:MAG TPA: sorbosone dehydrogenase family protein [Candidatus Sulfotelmatobacter sp.]|jgi:glucose/arabinose dehydrogenase|nr:sorbosone dehydrogenase family protein [Candidatus Sulfotelmatobacter sp.]